MRSRSGCWVGNSRQAGRQQAAAAFDFEMISMMIVSSLIRKLIEHQRLSAASNALHHHSRLALNRTVTPLPPDSNSRIASYPSVHERLLPSSAAAPAIRALGDAGSSSSTAPPPCSAEMTLVRSQLRAEKAPSHKAVVGFCPPPGPLS